MRQLVFCEYCMKENEYKVHKINKTSILNGEEINYMTKEVVCNSCGNDIFVSDICDYNLKALYKEYRKKHNIIPIQEIHRIIIKYCINEKSLALLLGWDKETISRYLDGDMPTSSHSDILKKVQENPEYYLILLQSNKERINILDYSKSRQAVKNILSINIPEDRMNAVIKYILIRCEDITSKALQNLLYYVQASYYMFSGDFIFEEDCEAFIDGPVYRSVYEKYETIGYDQVNKEILSNNKLKLEDIERNVVESVIKFYGCYSGKILKQMTRNESPWIFTRTKGINEKNPEDDNFSKIIERDLIQEYFTEIKEKYNIVNLIDIERYSMDLFNKISM